MLIPLLIALSFSIGFFIESIIGFGGGLIAYSILGFFMDIKKMVIIGVYIGSCASAYILITDHRSFSKKIFFQSMPICFLGTMIGSLIFSNIDSQTILILFGAFAIILSAKVIFFDKIQFPTLFKNALLLTGGFSTGLFGIGGPFIVNALKDTFKGRSELRSTMAGIFVAMNVVRIIQLSIQGEIRLELFADTWWTVIPALIAIYFGYKAHLKISEVFFKKMVGAMTLFSGIVFLFK
jgi:uncharacterized protein